MEIIQSIIGFIIAIGILVTFHEFGHFYVARLFDVKVLNFNVGFGKNIYTKKFKGDETEYSIGMIPLGGYVKMLESHELDTYISSSSNRRKSSRRVKYSESYNNNLAHCFDTQSVYKRFLIVAAGPIFNLILAVVFFTMVHFFGISGMKPIFESIDPISNNAEPIIYKNMEIYRVNNNSTKRWQDVRMELLNNIVDKKEITLYVKDNNNNFYDFKLPVDQQNILKKEGDIIKNLGIKIKQPVIPSVIGNVQKNSPANIAKLLPGDQILEINQNKIKSWNDLVKIIEINPNKQLEIKVNRSDSIHYMILTPSEKNSSNKIIGFAGISPDPNLLNKYRVTVKYPIIASIYQSVELTYHYSALTLKMISKLFFGEANLKNLSGPISIAEFTGKSLSMGFVYFAYILAILSISLGILNLLPIPMLDGGHLLFYTFEILIGKPVPEKIQLFGQQLGIVLLFGIMILALYNDLLRLL